MICEKTGIINKELPYVKKIKDHIVTVLYFFGSVLLLHSLFLKFWIQRQ